MAGNQFPLGFAEGNRLCNFHNRPLNTGKEINLLWAIPEPFNI